MFWGLFTMQYSLRFLLYAKLNSIMIHWYIVVLPLVVTTGTVMHLHLWLYTSAWLQIEKTRGACLFAHVLLFGMLLLSLSLFLWFHLLLCFGCYIYRRDSSESSTRATAFLNSCVVWRVMTCPGLLQLPNTVSLWIKSLICITLRVLNLISY